ncbi:hypothetical protein [Paraburkholderia sp. USG1]|uniref:hypothetical protein n=1 Tax=Paraburkholderia sp. USG1 TaxID=2952268 RepID=UPI00386207C0
MSVDIAKRIFQLHRTGGDTGKALDRRLRRSKFLEHFANRSLPYSDGDGGNSNNTGNATLIELGHEIKLMFRQTRQGVCEKK